MEYSLAQSLEGYSEVANVPFPRLNSDPAIDFVNPGLGQIVNLFETIVPVKGHSLHTIEKKVEKESDEISKNVLEQSIQPPQTGFGESPIDPTILNSFLHPIVTDSIIFPKNETNDEKRPKKQKMKGPSSDNVLPPKRLKINHKFQIV